MTHSMFDLTDRVAVVTGTAQGMGRAMATAFAEAGANVLLLDRNQEGNEATAHALARLGRKVVPLACDIASFEQIDHVYETLDKEFGRIDILGNVAGEAHTGPAEDMSIEQVQQTFHNLVISRFYA